MLIRSCEKMQQVMMNLTFVSVTILHVKDENVWLKYKLSHHQNCNDGFSSFNQLNEGDSKLIQIPLCTSIHNIKS